MRFIPKVSLHGSGESVELSNGSRADFTLMQGASGLGMRPQENTTVALPSGGSLLRHRKGLEATVQLPILLGGSERERWDLRRKLERLVRDEVEIRVTRPNGLSRSRFGFYKQGLEGEYGAGEDSPNGQKIVLEFVCPDGLWKGAELDPQFKLRGLRKRFLSDRPEPIAEGATVRKESRAPTSKDVGKAGDVWLVGTNATPDKVLRRNVAANPSFESGTSVVRSSALMSIATVDSGNAVAGSKVLEATVNSEGTYVYLGQDLPASELVIGKWIGSAFRQRWVSGSKYFRSRVNYTGGSPWSGDFVDGSDGEWKVLTAVSQISEGTTRIMPAGYVFDAADVNSRAKVGTKIQQDAVMYVVGDSEADVRSALASYFDGSTVGTRTKAYRWTGTPNASISEEYAPAREFTATARYKHDGKA